MRIAICDDSTKDAEFVGKIVNSLASPSTVADVMTKKYVDGLPLARQEKIWARQGGAEQSHAGQLGNPNDQSLAETAIQAYEGSAAEGKAHSRR